jgi:hypothetical protein
MVDQTTDHSGDLIRLSDLPLKYDLPMAIGDTLTISWADRSVCLKAIDKDATGGIILRWEAGFLDHLLWMIDNGGVKFV